MTFYFFITKLASLRNKDQQCYQTIYRLLLNVWSTHVYKFEIAVISSFDKSLLMILQEQENILVAVIQITTQIIIG